MATLPPSTPGPAAVTPRPAIAVELLAWAARHGRSLPWRATRDPWAILVSELMLQQTQVARVVPKYLAFLERFPDPAAAAAAPLGQVLALWTGLGYNQRALRLHAAAAAVVEHHGGRIPDDLHALLGLPGVGPYTARAVLAFAFERPVGVLDTNAARLLARAVAGRPLRWGEAQRLADASVPSHSPWAYNQAVLDVGATVCISRRSPLCDRCPLVHSCAWAASGWTTPDPAAGTAGASGRQSIFAGSDRQGRGRLVAALVVGPLLASEVAQAAGWPDDPERAGRIVEGLIADGLVQHSPDGGVRLP